MHSLCYNSPVATPLTRELLEHVLPSAGLLPRPALATGCCAPRGTRWSKKPKMVVESRVQDSAGALMEARKEKVLQAASLPVARHLKTCIEAGVRSMASRTGIFRLAAEVSWNLPTLTSWWPCWRRDAMLSAASIGPLRLACCLAGRFGVQGSRGQVARRGHGAALSRTFPGRRLQKDPLRAGQTSTCAAVQAQRDSQCLAVICILNRRAAALPELMAGEADCPCVGLTLSLRELCR